MEKQNSLHKTSSWADSSIPPAPKGSLLRNISLRGSILSEQEILKQLETEALKRREQGGGNLTGGDKEKGAHDHGDPVPSGVLLDKGKIEDWTDLPPVVAFDRNKIPDHFLDVLMDECFFLPPTLLNLFEKYTPDAATAIASSTPRVIIAPCEALDCLTRIFFSRWKHSAADPIDRRQLFPSSLLNRVMLYLVERECEKLDDPALLFRENTNTSKVIQSFFRMRGNDYLRETLSPMIREIVDRDLRIEYGGIGQEKMEAEKNLRLLKNITQRIIDDIVASLKNVPAEIKIFCEELYEVVALRYGGSRFDNKAGKNAITAFFFLRFIVPIITTPHKLNIIEAAKTPRFSRTFILIAKTIQTLWNGTLFSASSAMTDVNHFIQENRDRANTFVLALASASGTPSLEFLPSMPETLTTAPHSPPSTTPLTTPTTPTTNPSSTSAGVDESRSTKAPQSPTSGHVSLTSLEAVAGRNRIGSFRLPIGVSQASLKRMQATGMPEAEWRKEVLGNVHTLLKFIMNQFAGFDICVGEMVHYNIRKGNPGPDAALFLKIKTTMDFIFEERDFVYQLGQQAQQQLPGSKALGLIKTTPSSPSKDKRGSVTVDPLSPRGRRKDVGKIVKGNRGAFYQSPVHSPYESPTLLHWVNKEASEHQYLILIFYRGQWCPFCKEYITYWDTNNLCREIIENNAIIYGVCSQTPMQTKKTQEKWKVKNFDLLGDPNNTLARYYALEITFGFEQEGGYHDGMGQPGVIAFNQKGEIIYYWSSVPSFKNFFGARDRPDPFDVLRDLSLGRTFGTGKVFTREKDCAVCLTAGGDCITTAGGGGEDEEGCAECAVGPPPAAAVSPPSGRRDKTAQGGRKGEQEAVVGGGGDNSATSGDTSARPRLPRTDSDDGGKKKKQKQKKKKRVAAASSSKDAADDFLRAFGTQDDEGRKRLVSSLLRVYPSQVLMFKEALAEVDAELMKDRHAESTKLLGLLLKNYQDLEKRLEELERSQRQHQLPPSQQQHSQQKPSPTTTQGDVASAAVAVPKENGENKEADKQPTPDADGGSVPKQPAPACTLPKDEVERRRKLYYL